jgi:hypothetical protein
VGDENITHGEEPRPPFNLKPGRYFKATLLLSHSTTFTSCIIKLYDILTLS